MICAKLSIYSMTNISRPEFITSGDPNFPGKVQCLDNKVVCSRYTSNDNTLCVDDINDCPVTDIRIVPSTNSLPSTAPGVPQYTYFNIDG